MAKSKKNKFEKSNWYSDDFEEQKISKKKTLKNKAMYEDDFQEDLTTMTMMTNNQILVS